MAIKNRTQYAILGILKIAPGSGYDIKKYCDTVISNVWNENFGHIYPVLNTMLAGGLIERDGDGISARKKVYTITDKGKAELLDWLSLPAEYQPVRSEFMLKFLFSSELPKKNTLEMLGNYKKHHEKNLKEFITIEQYLNQEQKLIQSERKSYLRSTVRHGILSAEASIRWCNEVMDEMSLK